MKSPSSDANYHLQCLVWKCCCRASMLGISLVQYMHIYWFGVLGGVERFELREFDDSCSPRWCVAVWFCKPEKWKLPHKLHIIIRQMTIKTKNNIIISFIIITRSWMSYENIFPSLSLVLTIPSSGNCVNRIKYSKTLNFLSFTTFIQSNGFYITKLVV